MGYSTTNSNFEQNNFILTQGKSPLLHKKTKRKSRTNHANVIFVHMSTVKGHKNQLVRSVNSHNPQKQHSTKSFVILEFEKIKQQTFLTNFSILLIYIQIYKSQMRNAKYAQLVKVSSRASWII